MYTSTVRNGTKKPFGLLALPDIEMLVTTDAGSKRRAGSPSPAPGFRRELSWIPEKRNSQLGADSMGVKVKSPLFILTNWRMYCQQRVIDDGQQ